MVCQALLTGEVGEPILGRTAKVDALREVAAKLNITPADAIAVGDGANDLDMLAAAAAKTPDKPAAIFPRTSVM